MLTDPKSTLAPEENLLLALCRLNFTVEQRAELGLLVKEVTDWGHFINMSNDLGMIAQSWFNLSSTGFDKFIPDNFSQIMHSAYLKSMTYNIFLAGVLDEIASLAEEQNIKLGVLKGMALEKLFYGNKGIRQISDIDILVRSDQAIKLRELLLKKGFQSPGLISPLHVDILHYLRHHLPAMIRNGASVEIHVRLFDEKDNYLTNLLFESALPFTGKEGFLYFPEPRVFFLYLIRHILSHERSKELQLKSFADLIILLSTFPDILNSQLFHLAKEAELMQPLSEKLRLLELFWEIYVPGSTRNNLEDVDDREASERFIDFIRNPVNYKRTPHDSNLLKPIKRIPGFTNKLKFITGYIFPSLSYLKYKYHFRNNLAGLFYYAFRWVELVMMVLKK